MAEAARMAPQRIKVSSKRQITIPAKAYKDMGFTEYALIEATRVRRWSSATLPCALM